MAAGQRVPVSTLPFIDDRMGRVQHIISANGRDIARGPECYFFPEFVCENTSGPTA